MAPKRPLSARDVNSNMPSSTGTKRKQVVVDLTRDDSSTEDEAPAKLQKSAARTNARRRVPQKLESAANAYQTPPFRSAPGGSQHRVDIANQQSEAERDTWLIADDEAVDVNEIVSSTQDATDYDQLHLYGDLPTKIVGVQYYEGMANPGEYILLRREPSNPYDRNAIRVDNVAGQQIGHIPRRIAEKLAHLIDLGWLIVEGRLAGSIGPYDCPLDINLYGPNPDSDVGEQILRKMAADKLLTKALLDAKRREKERQKELEHDRRGLQQQEKELLKEARRHAAGGRITVSLVPGNQQAQFVNDSTSGPSSQPILQDLLEASQRFNPRDTGSATDQYGLQEEALRSMPLAKKPEAIRTDMLPYQLQALQWLLDQETPRLPAAGSLDAVQLWKRQGAGATFVNIATNHPQAHAPVLASGGILADDMGLGKTLEMISLIVADADKFGRGNTLVIAPLSVISNWSGQIAHHINEKKKLSVYIYHGTGRVKMDASDFAQHDVVITTYQTLASDFGTHSRNGTERKLRSSGLYSVHWRRIILDEGHTIRNPASKGAAAVNALTARSKWVLTGTPIVNSLKDLYSLLRFVGVSGGLEQLPVFNSVLVRPLKIGEPSAIYLLQAIMKAFTLRRRKDMAFIDLRLPELENYTHTIHFTDKEQQRYNALLMQARGLLSNVERKAPEKGESKAQTYQHLLEVLLRLRQCCNHWQLCGERVTNLLAELEKQKTVALTPENLKALQDLLQVQIESHEECPICYEPLRQPVITTCAHSFCRECIRTTIGIQQKCPMCRAELRDETVLVEPINECGDELADDEMDLTQSSSKLELLMQILAATKGSTNGEKTVIFSQWTRFLDIIQSRLDRDGYKYCRIDGTMKAAQRDEALHVLASDPECTIMLASLGVCAVGLNLTAANNIILSDTWWAPAIEDQAVDRVHRLGQKKQTRVWRLVVEGTIEQRTLDIQSEKRKLMHLAFSEKGGKREKTQAGRLADIQRLLASQPSTSNSN